VVILYAVAEGVSQTGGKQRRNLMISTADNLGMPERLHSTPAEQRQLSFLLPGGPKGVDPVTLVTSLHLVNR
jgi:hypothetical protein